MFHDNRGFEGELVDEIFALVLLPLFLISSAGKPNNGGVFNIINKCEFIMLEIFEY